MKTNRSLVTEVISGSCEETYNAGYEFAKMIKYGDFIAFFGQLGSGKTTFIRGMGEYLCPGAHISSPSFTIVNEYGGEYDFRHLDMYRINSYDDLYSVGFFDFEGVRACEWSEKIREYIPPEHYEVEMEYLDETKRKIRIYKIC